MTPRKKQLIIFGISMLVIAAILFLVPINLFDGEIVFSINGFERVEKAKLSLSYFIGIGASAEDLKDVKDFYLVPMGYFFAFLIIVCLPALISYRFYLKDTKDKK